jgi:hypothetical protein
VNRAALVQCWRRLATVWTPAPDARDNRRMMPRDPAPLTVVKLSDHGGQYVLILKCAHCGHTRDARPEVLARLAGWETPLAAVLARLRCSQCGAHRCVGNSPPADEARRLGRTSRRVHMPLLGRSSDPLASLRCPARSMPAVVLKRCGAILAPVLPPPNAHESSRPVCSRSQTICQQLARVHCLPLPNRRSRYINVHASMPVLLAQ